MAQIRNNSKQRIGFTGSPVVLAPGQTEEISNWDDIKDKPFYKHYLKEGALEVLSGRKEEDADPKPETPSSSRRRN